MKLLAIAAFALVPSSILASWAEKEWCPTKSDGDCSVFKEDGATIKEIDSDKCTEMGFSMCTGLPDDPDDIQLPNPFPFRDNHSYCEKRKSNCHTSYAKLANCKSNCGCFEGFCYMPKCEKDCQCYGGFCTMPVCKENCRCETGYCDMPCADASSSPCEEGLCGLAVSVTPEILSIGKDGAMECKAGSSAGLIAGLVVGIAVLGAGGFYFWKKKQNQSKNKSAAGGDSGEAVSFPISTPGTSQPKTEEEEPKAEEDANLNNP